MATANVLSSAVVRTQGPKQITNRQGSQNLVVVAADGSVSLHDSAILRIDPLQDAAPYTTVLAKIRSPGNKGGKEYPKNITRDIGFVFEDGSCTSLAGIDGCIVSYNKARLDTGMSTTGTGDRKFSTQYGVTTLTLGIPEARYDQLAANIFAHHRIRLDKGAENGQGGYVWIDGSVTGMPKNGNIDARSAEFYATHGRQVFYVDEKVTSAGRTLTPVALGPFYHCMEIMAASMLGVFYGNLRLKATIDKEGDKPKYKLGMTIHHLQISTIVAQHAPDLITKTSNSLMYAGALPSPQMLMMIQDMEAEEARLQEQEDNEEEEADGEGHEEEDAGDADELADADADEEE